MSPSVHFAWMEEVCTFVQSVLCTLDRAGVPRFRCAPCWCSFGRRERRRTPRPCKPTAFVDMPMRNNLPSRPLPNATGAAFLHTPHLLRETVLGSPRFVAVSPLPSIFTWWNILDATMASAPSSHNTWWQTGYVRELQVRRMVQLAQHFSRDRAVHYCEVGMNGGHSAVSMLLAHPNLTAHVFDPLEYDYSAPVVKLLTDTFQERFALTKGAPGG